jgi:hypothetical protein
MAETGTTGKFWVHTHDWLTKKIVKILAVLVLKIFFDFLFLIFGRGMDAMQ